MHHGSVTGAFNLYQFDNEYSGIVAILVASSLFPLSFSPYTRAPRYLNNAMILQLRYIPYRQTDQIWRRLKIITSPNVKIFPCIFLHDEQIELRNSWATPLNTKRPNIYLTHRVVKPDCTSTLSRHIMHEPGMINYQPTYQYWLPGNPTMFKHDINFDQACEIFPNVVYIVYL